MPDSRFLRLPILRILGRNISFKSSSDESAQPNKIPLFESYEKTHHYPGSRRFANARRALDNAHISVFVRVSLAEEHRIIVSLMKPF